MNEQQGSEKPIAPVPQPPTKPRSRTLKIIGILLLLLILGSSYFAWFGVIGSGLPIAVGSRYHLDRGIANELLVGPNHNIWFNDLLKTQGEGLTTQLGSITPDGRQTSIHQIYSGSFDHSYVRDLSVSADGTIWGLVTLWNTDERADGGTNAIWHIDARTGTVTLYPQSLLQTNQTGAVLPTGIVAGRDGYIWFIGDVVVSPGNFVSAVSRLDPRTGAVKRYLMKLGDSAGINIPVFGQIAQGLDGDLWFSILYLKHNFKNDFEAVGRLYPQTGTINSITLPLPPNMLTYDPGNLNGPSISNGPSLLPTPDGGIWVLRTLLPSSGPGNFFTRLNYVSPSGQVTTTSAPDDGLIEGFALAPDHTLWAVYSAPYHWPFSPIVTQENRLARVSPDGTFTTLRRLPAGDVTDIAIGQNSQLWIAIEDHPGMDIEGIMLPA